MGFKKFIKQVKLTLGLNDYKVEGKKKSLKALLKKLNERKRSIEKSLKNSLQKKETKKTQELKEELEIVSLQIKKGKKILHELYKNKSDNTHTQKHLKVDKENLKKERK